MLRECLLHTREWFVGLYAIVIGKLGTAVKNQRSVTIRRKPTQISKNNHPDTQWRGAQWRLVKMGVRVCLTRRKPSSGGGCEADWSASAEQSQRIGISRHDRNSAVHPVSFWMDGNTHPPPPPPSTLESMHAFPPRRARMADKPEDTTLWQIDILKEKTSPYGCGVNGRVRWSVAGSSLKPISKIKINFLFEKRFDGPASILSSKLELNYQRVPLNAADGCQHEDTVNVITLRIEGLNIQWHFQINTPLNARPFIGLHFCVNWLISAHFKFCPLTGLQMIAMVASVLSEYCASCGWKRYFEAKGRFLLQWSPHAYLGFFLFQAIHFGSVDLGAFVYRDRTKIPKNVWFAFNTIPFTNINWWIFVKSVHAGGGGVAD